VSKKDSYAIFTSTIIGAKKLKSIEAEAPLPLPQGRGSDSEKKDFFTFLMKKRIFSKY